MAARRTSLADIWPELEEGMTKLLCDLNEGFPRKKWVELYTQVYNYCTTARLPGKRTITGANFVGEELYDKLVDFLKAHVTRLRRQLASRMDESLLHYYNIEWERYTTCMKYVNHIFQYLNRHWVKREAEEGKRQVYEIKTLALVVWRDAFFGAVKDRLTNALLALVEKERNGEQVDTHLLANVIGGYVDLGLSKTTPVEKTLHMYKEEFEAEFMFRSETYYTAESLHFLSTNPVADYMRKAEARLAEERRRVQQYLHPSTEGALISRLEKVLIGIHVEAIWADFQNLLEADKLDDLTRMYALLSKVPRGLDPLRSVLEKHVEAVGAAAVQQLADTGEANNPAAYVQTLLRVYGKYQAMVDTAFRGDLSFVQCLDKACRHFVNDNAVTAAAKTSAKSPELLARHCDALLRKSSKAAAEETELEATLNRMLVVFNYIDDKDVFQTFYSKMFAKRLIHGTSASEDLEGTMIGKLKAACGYDYTAKLQRMFQDMELSRELLDKFRAQLSGADAKALGVDFSVMVLATGSWPLQVPASNFAMPRELEQCDRLFTKFYVQQHSGRKLQWLHQLSKGEVRTGYLGATYTFQCSTYQIAVLSMFNALPAGKSTLTASDIQQATLLSDAAMRITLLSLAKTRVLLMSPRPTGGVIDGATKFALNRNFKSKKMRVLINVPVPQQAASERAATHTRIDEDRKLLVQAAIVRVMKARKSLAHGKLIAEVISQLNPRFVPKVPQIKQQIGVLLEREYLSRGEGSVYQYVA